MKRKLVLSDNEYLLTRFRELIDKKKLEQKYHIDFAYSSTNKSMKEKYADSPWISGIEVKSSVERLILDYDLILSLHCKQLFPSKLVRSILCINIHPGLNPFNRGWYPQVFSIINGLPCGATIHVIDEKLDHGPVIIQKEVNLEPWDTSFTAYNKILDMEMELLESQISGILEGSFSTFIAEEGNINYKSDFDNLCQIDLNEKDTFQNHLNKLRALTHGEYSNAFFIDNNGDKIFVKLELKKVSKD